jgi:hypothetical protein
MVGGTVSKETIMSSIHLVPAAERPDVRAALEYAIKHHCYRKPTRRAALKIALAFLGDRHERNVPEVAWNLCELAKYVARETASHHNRLAWVAQFGKAMEG